MKLLENFENSNIYRSSIHNLIPGGAHTYSKGDDQFPEISPAAIKKGKGAYVWDLDDNKYLDCSMGLTSVSLGHAFEPVDDAVIHALKNGVNFQRPSYLEKEMAEKFLDLIPVHQMIKFAKNGSSVTTAAVKLARAYTGRKYVAFPSDHPFYSYDDWFIGKTLCNKGVPQEFSSLSLTFKSTDLKTLEELFSKYPDQIACVISEPEKSNVDDPFYAQNLQKICQQNRSIFIVDEMITGFKTDFPGSIKKLNLSPDLATWGKGIANGYSFCALTGKKEIMELGGIKNTGQEKVFLISSTHGGETTSMAACMATIDIFRKQNVLAHNHAIGKYFSECCSQLIKTSGLQDFVSFQESEWFPILGFKNLNKELSAGFRTLALQEMIKRGVLFQGVFVPCYSHSKIDVDFFCDALKETLDVYRSALEGSLSNYLVGNETKPVFRKIL